MEVVGEAEEDAAVEALKTEVAVEAEAALTAVAAVVSANGTDLSEADLAVEARRPVAVVSAALTRPMIMTTILTCRIRLPTTILTHPPSAAAAITAADEVIIMAEGSAITAAAGVIITAEETTIKAEAEVR